MEAATFVARRRDGGRNRSRSLRWGRVTSRSRKPPLPARM